MANSYRSILEVLRFAAPKELLTSASELCMLWLKAANSDELWWDLCDLYRIPTLQGQTSGKLSFKEGCFDMLIQELPLVRPNSVVRFSIPDLKQTTVQLSTTLKGNHFSAYCYLNLTRLMICGGGDTQHNYVFAIELDSGEVTQLASMIQERRSHAAYKWYKFVYVFGGYKGRNLDTIEKYSVKEDRWETLETRLTYPMEAFVPARYKLDLYLVGALHIEIFNLRSETCRLFPLSLPKTWFYTLPFLTNEGELVIAQKDKILYCSVADVPSNFISIDIPQIANGNYWTTGTPVKHGEAIYCFHHTHGTIEGILKMKKYSLSRIFDINYE